MRDKGPVRAIGADRAFVFYGALPLPPVYVTLPPSMDSLSSLTSSTPP